uniref:U-scoloptoxin(18)-Er1a n=1 Tax=Ethmostigmus rubripes TaxID=62613 RepID=TXI1A_ETHRU|nr:RecName: Full=U-scoloptoxin(18)-Er1a; Short=U-SLPTX(18)-Er1a; Flags: Precursor [Ethmostigmus rubripes]
MQRFLCLVACSVVLLVLGIVADDEIGQVPEGGWTRGNKSNGERCKFNQHCHSKCCVLSERGKPRVCASKALEGESCNAGQIKGGYHARFCPCALGNGKCIKNICQLL